MSNIIKPGLALFVIAVIASGLLGLINASTKNIIAKNLVAEKKAALLKILPLGEGGSFSEDYDIAPKPDSGVISYNIGYENDKIIGFAMIVKQPAYSGSMELLVGMDMNGVIKGVEVLNHSETPGLGAHAAEEKFTSQFIGKSGNLTAVKNGAHTETEIDAITSATITSNAVVKAVNTALEFHSQIFLNGGVK